MAIWGVGIMVGPILGPTLGGYLTETYDWRWVFYINLPFGILALLGILAFVPETPRERDRGFDIIGFALLSLSIGALQLMLDRGETLDWFGSTEIILEAVAAGLFFYMFLVHIFTAEKPFLDPALFKDRNLSIGLVFIFIVGIILLATLALLPPFLENLLNYPVLTTGYVLAPRGAGTMVAMLLVGRLIGKVDTRWLILTGLGLTALSLWEMAQFTTDIGVWSIVHTGVVQGLGLGFIFVPLTTSAFATLPPKYRTDGTAMFSLMRNLGSSIGVSIVVTLLAQNTQVNHATLADRITPFRPAMESPWLPHAWNWTTTSGVTALSDAVTRQAMTIAFLDDFALMMWITLLAIPLLLLMRPSKRGAAPTAVAAD
jgi:DHA2 family multidrug resistance protein